MDSIPETSTTLHITTRQPSAYWTGRFVSLHDRFHQALLEDDSLSTIMAAHAANVTEVNRRQKNMGPSAGLSASTTTAALSTVSASWHSAAAAEVGLLGNEESLSRRVFLHLEALCLTSEAKQSLREWQQVYVREMRRRGLLS
jgi:hypothetical protein